MFAIHDFEAALRSLPPAVAHEVLLESVTYARSCERADEDLRWTAAYLLETVGPIAAVAHAVRSAIDDPEATWEGEEEQALLAAIRALLVPIP
jgi:hypothetical protein